MSSTTDRKIRMRESIAKAFEEHEIELAVQLVEVSRLPDEEEFLVKERTILSQQLKDILIILIPAIISIVGFIVVLLTQVGLFKPSQKLYFLAFFISRGFRSPILICKLEEE